MECEDSVSGKVWEAVQRMSVSALRYAERYYVRDPSVVAGSLEDAAEAMLRVNRGNLERVRNLDAYLLRAFTRKIKRHVAREIKLVGIEYAEQIPDPSDDVFRRLFAHELIAMMDDSTRLLFERWVAGYSWAEIGRELGIDPHLAEQHFYLGLRNLHDIV
jgi:DNA-directed RNA polymerase specialized sigma24 family protein